MSKNQISSKNNFRSHRQKIIDAKLIRGKRVHNIWSIYSTKNRKNCILLSDAEYCNCVWLEGDPTVQSYEIESDLFLIDNDESHGATYPDAIVKFKDTNKTVQWREVKAEEDSNMSEIRDIRQKRIQERITTELGLEYLRVTPSLLLKQWQFIRNWRRCIPFLSAARHMDLTKYGNELHAFIYAKKHITLGECMTQYSKEYQPLAIAGILLCAQNGLIKTDLETHQLGPATLLECISE